MCLENQTIGFIENSFQDVVDTKRQYIFDKYKVDLYFPEYKLVIECDENNHDDRNPNEEKIREEYILSLGNSMIRFNPNDSKFELSIVLREINKILFSKESIENIKLILLP
jgi:very-short-patch-repair endonuclease